MSIFQKQEYDAMRKAVWAAAFAQEVRAAYRSAWDNGMPDKYVREAYAQRRTIDVLEYAAREGADAAFAACRIFDMLHSNEHVSKAVTLLHGELP